MLLAAGGPGDGAGNRQMEGKRAEELAAAGFDTVQGAAKFLGVSRAYVYLLMGRGELAFALFGRCRRIPRRARVEYAARRLVGGELNPGG